MMQPLPGGLVKPPHEVGRPTVPPAAAAALAAKVFQASGGDSEAAMAVLAASILSVAAPEQDGEASKHTAERSAIAPPAGFSCPWRCNAAVCRQ